MAQYKFLKANVEINGFGAIGKPAPKPEYNSDKEKTCEDKKDE